MQYLIATTFEVVHYIALQAVHYKPLQEVHLSRYNQRTLGRDSFIMNIDDYSIVCFHDIIIYYMFPANKFGDSLAGNLRFAIFAINFFEHFKYLYFNTLSYKKVIKKARVIH